MLWDNIFHGADLTCLLREAGKKAGESIFIYYVHDLQRYGVVEMDASRKIITLQKKALKTKVEICDHGLVLL
jgi:glucose-1-phosphate thymidylyltransferase